MKLFLSVDRRCFLSERFALAQLHRKSHRLQMNRFLLDINVLLSTSHRRLYDMELLQKHEWF